MKKIILVKVLIFLICSTCFSQAWKENLSFQIQKLRMDPDFKHGRIGMCVLNARTGKMLFESNAQDLLVPASTLKTITTAAALGILGKDFRYETRLFTEGEFDQSTGVLHGNLIIVGSGDPSLGSEYFNKLKDSLTDVEREFLEAVRKKGIKKIEGKILVDNSCFDNAVPDDWIWSDLGNYYGASPNGLSFRDNKILIYFSSQGEGKKTKVVKIEPKGLEMQLINEVYSGDREENTNVFLTREYDRRIATGTIPPNKVNYEVEGSMPNPEICFKNGLTGLLNYSKIEIENKTIETQKNKVLLYTHYSPQLEKIVFFCNLKSNNHYAESILKTIGLVKKGKGNIESGVKAVEEFLLEKGAGTDGLIMNDGSGLSRSNGITPFLQASFLHKIYNDSVIYNPFNRSLPVSGKSGTLTNLGKGSCIEGNLRAKSGYIKRVRSYCGYMDLANGETICFSVICNNFSCKPSEMKKKIEKILEGFCSN